MGRDMIGKIKKKIIGGHRGSPKKARENTLQSFETAISDGADFIEFDVRKSRDSRLIVHHDADAAGQTLRNLKLSEIAALKNETGYEIPTLEDTLRACVNRIMLDVEIKEPDITEDTVRLLLKYYPPEKFIITSFFDAVIKYLQEAHPQIKRGLLFDIESDFDLENRIKKLKPDFLMAHFLTFNSDLRKTCAISGLKCIVWTVNDPDEIKRFLLEDHVAGIISDRPELAVSIYKKVLNR